MGQFITELSRISIDEALKAAPITDEKQALIRLHIGKPYNSTVSLPITDTTPFYGGQRWWFECPLVTCGRRTPHLYVDNGDIACRKCLSLRYETQYYSKGTLNGIVWAMHQADMLRASGRRLWYGKYPTRTGRRYLKLCFSVQPVE